MKRLSILKKFEHWAMIAVVQLIKQIIKKTNVENLKKK